MRDQGPSSNNPPVVLILNMALGKGIKRAPQMWSANKPHKRAIAGGTGAMRSEDKEETFDIHMQTGGGKSGAPSDSSRSKAVKPCPVPSYMCKEVLDEYCALSERNSLRTSAPHPAASRRPTNPSNVGRAGK